MKHLVWIDPGSLLQDVNTHKKTVASGEMVQVRRVRFIGTGCLRGGWRCLFAPNGSFVGVGCELILCGMAFVFEREAVFVFGGHSAAPGTWQAGYGVGVAASISQRSNQCKPYRHGFSCPALSARIR